MIGPIAAAVALCATLVACSAPTPPSAITTPAPMTTAAPSPTSPGTDIRIILGASVINAQLRDNAPARALTERLPLTLNFSDLNGVEKIARLDAALPMTGMPDSDDPEPGDIGWYAPSGDLVLYYGDVGRWPGIARIGNITGDLNAIAIQQNDFTATIELAT